LNLIGDEFKTARKHLLAALPGDSAFKRGRPQAMDANGDEPENVAIAVAADHTEGSES